MVGVIKKVVSEKGFGFIKPEDGSKDIFFHANDLQNVEFKDLVGGESVSYDVQETPKGLKAVDILLN
jgi:CspA family cold shock protein